jgi:hypothetical protein
MGGWCASAVTAQDRAAEDHFESRVRPILVARCVGCHGGTKQSAGLRLDARAGLLQGGESGPALSLDLPDQSRLLAAIRYDGDLQMPPDEPLKPDEVAAIEVWLKQGAPWPDNTERLVAPSEQAARDHWAFQPLRDVAVPRVVVEGRPVINPIDAFVLERRQAAGLTGAPPADRRTLIRRLSYTLTGLPPSSAEVDAFLHDPAPDAVEQLVERLLASPHYGEHWARHWLDVARYSDTKGYVYAREERFWIHAWAYRDWVIQAFQRNLPYDQFLRLQLAADQVPDRTPEDLAAMGFLTLGRRFLGVTHDIIDDRIDVVTRGTMGLTVSCARCHDHKYDPIPTADYYSLYGVFDNSTETLLPASSQPPGDEAFRQELAKRQAAARDHLQRVRAITAGRVRMRLPEYLFAQLELEKYPPQGFDQVFQKSDLLPAFVRHWARYLRAEARSTDPVFRAWRAYAALPKETFAAEAPPVMARLMAEGEPPIHPQVAALFTTPPDSLREVIDRYAKLLLGIESRWQGEHQRLAELDAAEPPTGFPDPQDEALRQVLYGPTAPCEVPDLPVVHTETFVDSATCNEMWRMQGEIERWLIQSPVAAPYAVALIDRDDPLDAPILKRGNSLTPGELVPRRFLAVIAGDERRPFQHGSGRRELAEAIVDPHNPLTARVFVNRVWAAHFGRGLVPTTSDFGLRADPPSHPELLDWLARDFIANGWDIQRLQRFIVLSETYRQGSGPTDPDLYQQAQRVDPGNRLLWRGPTQRLSFEELRDSLLAAGEELDRTVGGKPVDLWSPSAPPRRTIYGLVDRQYLPGTLRMFDFANPDLHIPQRSETTVPQQALFFLNHPLMLARIRRLAAVGADLPNDTARVHDLFQRILQREPTEIEMAEALALVASIEPAITPPALPTAREWAYGYGPFDASSQRVISFTPLPHFTGAAWQGGPQWPDAQLGWVQLTATGGHPGNDLAHAAVRRWTAPRAGLIHVTSKLVHEPTQGDGIRGFLVSSRDGVWASSQVHHGNVEWKFTSRAVEAGETLDFVVDIGGGLAYDQFLWSITITADADAAGAATTWNAERDFPPVQETQRLTPWEQLAQVLVCTNEFFFVD